MPRNELQPGDWVVYRKTKHSTCPGPRATEISPSRGGDTYSYIVDKYWVVTAVGDGSVRVRTRRGKEHEVEAGDPNLHRASWWERLRFRSRFLAIESDNAPVTTPSAGKPAVPAERVV